MFTDSSVPDLYADKLVQDEVLNLNECAKIRDDYMEYLNQELSAADNYQPDVTYFQRQWKHITAAPDNALTFWDTGVDYRLLHYIGQQSVAYPENFVSSPRM